MVPKAIEEVAHSAAFVEQIIMTALVAKDEHVFFCFLLQEGTQVPKVAISGQKCK